MSASRPRTNAAEVLLAYNTDDGFKKLSIWNAEKAKKAQASVLDLTTQPDLDAQSIGGVITESLRRTR